MISVMLKKCINSWPVMDSDGQLPITVHQWSFLNNEDNEYFFIWFDSNSQWNNLFFHLILPLFCKILPNFNEKMWFLWCKKSAWTNGQWWTVMGSCPSLPINGPSWTMDIMLDLWFDFNKIHSGVTYFSIDFVFFPKISRVFSKILEYFSQYLWFLWR